MFGIKNPVELKNLDKIVDDLLGRYDDKVKAFIAEGNAPLAAEAASALEQGWVDELNAKYDEKAHKATGRKVSGNWKDGKDNMDVRKRILNRDFDKRRGKVFQSFGGALNDILAKVNSALACVEETNQAYFQSLKLPMDRKAIDEGFDQHKEKVRQMVEASYNGGIAQLDADSMLVKGVPSWDALVAEMTTHYDAIDGENDQLVFEMAAKIDELVAGAKLTVEAFSESEKTKLPVLPAVIAEDVAAFRGQLQGELEGKYEGGLAKADADALLAKGEGGVWNSINASVDSVASGLVEANAALVEEAKVRVTAALLERVRKHVLIAGAEVVNRNMEEVGQNEVPFLDANDSAAFLANLRNEAIVTVLQPLFD